MWGVSVVRGSRLSFPDGTREICPRGHLSHGFHVGGERVYLFAQIVRSLAQILKTALHLDLCIEQELILLAEFNTVVRDQFEGPLDTIQPPAHWFFPLTILSELSRGFEDVTHPATFVFGGAHLVNC